MAVLMRMFFYFPTCPRKSCLRKLSDPLHQMKKYHLILKEDEIVVLMPENSDEITLKFSYLKSKRVCVELEYSGLAESSVILIDRLIKRLRALDSHSKLKKITPPFNEAACQSNLGKHTSSELRSVYPANKKAKTLTSKSSSEWDDEQHLAFVRAVFSNGMKIASPSVIMEQMVARHPALNSERVKSHLQKFRKKPEQVSDFMQEFQESLKKYNHPIQVEEDSRDISKLIGAQGVAHLTHQVQTEGEERAELNQQIDLSFMTNEEANSAAGLSIQNTFRLMQSLLAQIYEERKIPASQDQEALSKLSHQSSDKQGTEEEDVLDTLVHGMFKDSN